MIESLMGMLKSHYHLEGKVGGWIYRADGKPIAHGWREFGELMQKRGVIMDGRRIDWKRGDAYLKSRDKHFTKPSPTHPHGEYAGPPGDTMITVKIGTFERTYILVETDAPGNYDGFGTMEIYSGPGDRECPDCDMGRGGGAIPCPRCEGTGLLGIRRYVLVDVEHAEWQEGRYRSGLHTYELVKEDLSQWVQEKLYERLMKGGTND